MTFHISLWKKYGQNVGDRQSQQADAILMFFIGAAADM